MSALRKGEQVEGVMLGDGWTKAEIVLRRAGATKADVLHAITLAEDYVATCKQYGDDATDAQERRRLILSRLVREEWNVSAAAVTLGISESGLRKLVTTYDLDQYRPAPAKRGRPKSAGRAGFER